MNRRNLASAETRTDSVEEVYQPLQSRSEGIPESDWFVWAVQAFVSVAGLVL
jgi:hypothetical protein